MINDFFKQIKADLAEYKEQYVSNSNIAREEWAFNYWVLDKLYNVDEDLIFQQIIDVHDKGIDCYHFDDENNVLYLIQNKYYDPDASSVLTNSYLNDLAVLPLGLLKQGKYTHCSDLQDIYNKLKRRKEYRIEFLLYITKTIDETARKKLFQQFKLNESAENIHFEIYDLNDIYKQYYADYSEGQNKSFSFVLNTKNDKLILDMKKNRIRYSDSRKICYGANYSVLSNDE